MFLFNKLQFSVEKFELLASISIYLLRIAKITVQLNCTWVGFQLMMNVYNIFQKRKDSHNEIHSFTNRRNIQTTS